jgi:Pyruvate/2-oxoacid:ferredoxin oxidoreductase gamma subunit
MKSFLERGGFDLFRHLGPVEELIGQNRHLNSAMLGVFAAMAGFSAKSWSITLEVAFLTKNLEDDLAAFGKALESAR